MWYTTSKVVWSWLVVNIRCPGHSRGINYSALNQTLNFWKEKYIEIFESVQCMQCWRLFADMTMLSSIRLAGILHKVFPKTYYSLAGNTFLGQPGDFLVLAHSNTFTEYWVIFLLFQFQHTASYSQMCFQWTHAPWQKTTITRHHPLRSYHIFSPVKSTIQI